MVYDVTKEADGGGGAAAGILLKRSPHEDFKGGRLWGVEGGGARKRNVGRRPDLGRPTPPQIAKGAFCEQDSVEGLGGYAHVCPLVSLLCFFQARRWLWECKVCLSPVVARGRAW